MACKIVAIFALMAVANAGIFQLDHQHVPYTVEHHTVPVEHHGPVYHKSSVAHIEVPQHHVLQQKHNNNHDYELEQYPDDPHPQYNFAYDVQDAVSGDSKSQTESRDGDVVRGEYSLTDADGFRRTVKYSADSVNGFNAVVHREPLSHKIVATASTVPLQYHHEPTNVSKKPTYTSLPVHHEHYHPTYTTYEVPANNLNHDNTHQYHYNH